MLHKFLTILTIITISIDTHSQSIDRIQLIRDLEYLASDQMEGRKPGTLGHRLAQDYIISRFNLIGLKPLDSNYAQIFNINTRSETLIGTNLIGKIHGLQDEVIIISAHYDHLGRINGKTFNGADDNASGIAAMLSIATYFVTNPPKYTLVFAAFDAEEIGLQGARFFVKGYKGSKIIANINMDMLSRSSKNELYACGTYHHPHFKTLLQSIDGDATVQLKYGHDNPQSSQQDWTYSSDHGAFHRRNIPFIYFGVEDHEDYHKFTDTADKIDQQFYANTVELILKFIIALDKS